MEHLVCYFLLGIVGKQEREHSYSRYIIIVAMAWIRNLAEKSYHHTLNPIYQTRVAPYLLIGEGEANDI